MTRSCTVGDDSAAPCPACGKDMSMQDLGVDGCLKPGFEDECEHCGALFEIFAVDYSATVYVCAAKTAAAPEPPPMSAKVTESYQRFLAEAAIGCRACALCWDVPCPACCAGGICDAICNCDSDYDDGDPGDAEDDDG